MKLPYSFRNVSRPLTLGDINDFEAERNLRLPSSYRRFLLDVNGGYPENQGFYYGSGKSFMVQRLYPLTSELEKWHNISTVNHSASLAPDGFLIIGISNCGDALCLGYDAPFEDKVIYLDHEERDPDEIEEDEWLGVYSLSDSFEAFMMALQNEWA